MWRRMDLVCLLLHLLSIASLWCEASAQSGADGFRITNHLECIQRHCVLYPQSGAVGPRITNFEECIERHCDRYPSTVVWGFIVTLVALTMAGWGFVKSSHESTIGRVFATLFVSVLNPLAIIWQLLFRAVDGMAMADNLSEAVGANRTAPLHPWIPIIVGTEVIVNLSQDANEEVCHFNTFEEKLPVIDYSEAVVIGAEVQDSHQYNLQLTAKGKLALLRSGVLLPYDAQLHILRGSPIIPSLANAATLAISVNVVRCMYRIVLRFVQGLPVSPLEAITCLLNIVIIMKLVLDKYASLAHRPLLLYLLPGKEVMFVEECKSVKSFEFRTQSRFRRGVRTRVFLLSAVTVYLICDFLRYVNVACVVPIIMFEVTLVLEEAQVLRVVCFDNRRFQSALLSKTLIVLLNGVAYVWALVVTINIKYWWVEQFYAQSSDYLL